MLIEVIATSLYDAIAIEKYGADRIELIENMSIGGITPDLRMSEEICRYVKLPVNIMIRPHAESFVYNFQDMQQIEEDINYIASKVNANGIVFGSLTEDGHINFSQLEKILKILERTRLSLTFHRAIDASIDPVQSFKDLTQYKGTALERVLTSGGKNTAIDGQENICKMLEIVHNQSSSIQIMVGSGLTPTNINDFLATAKVSELHFGSGLRNIDNQLQKCFFEELKIQLGLK